MDASLDFWFTSGRYSEEFEAAFSAFTGAEYSFLVNSGSSANLVAFAVLTSPLLGAKRLKPGDEVISVAAEFPTTVNPIIQHGMVPVFVDVAIGTYNIDVAELEKAIGPQTRAIFLAHTLGNPYDLDAVLRLVKKHDLWFKRTATAPVARATPAASVSAVSTEPCPRAMTTSTSTRT